MQRLLSLSKLLLRRSAERGCGSSSYAALHRSSSRPLESAAAPFSSKCFQQQRRTGTSNLSSEVFSCAFVLRQIVGRRTYFSAADFRSHLAVGSQSVKFSLFQRKGFGSWRPYGFWRSYWRYLPTSDEVVLGLIGANVAVYFLWRLTDLSFMRKHFMISLENLKNGHLHTMLTSAFSHSDLNHLVTNMIGLYFFGTNISRLFGPTFLLKLYVAGALGGSVFFLLHRTYIESTQRYHRRAEALGASAAVNAIILLDVFLFPKNIYYVNLVIPVPAVLMGAFIIGSDLWRIKKGDDQISGSAHLGGAFVALLAWAAVKKGWF